jgi:hypothetical protein
MGMPTDIGIIDLMLDPPALDGGNWAKKFAVRDAQSLSGEFQHPVGYMFEDAKPVSQGDPVSETLQMMDRHNVEMAVIRVTDDATGQPILQRPDRFMGSVPDYRVAKFGLTEPCGYYRPPAIETGIVTCLTDRRTGFSDGSCCQSCPCIAAWDGSPGPWPDAADATLGCPG